MARWIRSEAWVRHYRLVAMATLVLGAFGLSSPAATASMATTPNQYMWFWRPPPYVFPSWGGSAFFPNPSIIARDPVHPGTIYVGTVDCQPGCSALTAPPGGIYQTHDSGQTWQYLAGTDPGGQISTIAVDPKMTNVVLAGYSFYGENTIYSRPGTHPARPQSSLEYGDVLRSADGGASWVSVLPGAATTDIEFDPTNPNIVYASASPDYTRPQSIYRSTDAGQTWQIVSSQGIFFLQVDPAAPTVLFGSGAGFFRSNDSGVTWTAIPGPPGAVYFSRILVTPSNPNRMYAYNMLYAGIWRTDNEGQTWTDVTSNLPDVGFGRSVQSAAIDPGDGATIWVGLKYSGIFASTDGGSTWTDENAGIFGTGASNWGPQCISLALAANGEHAIVCDPFGYVYLRELTHPVFLPLVQNP